MLLDLPLKEANPDAYFARWQELGLDRQQVEGFRRSAASVIAVPLLIGRIPVSVLCIDTQVQLDEYESQVNDAVRVLVESVCPQLAALVELRLA